MATSHWLAASRLPASTRVSVALVRVHGQVGEVRAGALVVRSGHDEMHQAFGFADGGDGLAVGHSRHELFIHLPGKDGWVEIWLKDVHKVVSYQTGI